MTCFGTPFTADQILPTLTTLTATWTNYQLTFTYTEPLDGLYMAIIIEDYSGYDNNLGGFVLVDDVKIVPVIEVTESIEPTCDNQNSGSINLTVNGGSGNYTYSWSNGATTEDISGLAAGSYTVTITDTDLGCSHEETFEVPQVSCCPAVLNITNGTLSSSLPSVISGTVSITGQFFIDQTFTFSAATVKMSPGAEITVINGSTFYIINSEISSCNGIMWKTIEVTPTCRLRGLNSYIFEAENAIIARNQTTISLDRVEFKNNRVAFNIPVGNTPVNNVATNIINCNFHSVSPMPQPYPGQTTLVGTKGFTAFHVNNTNLALTAGLNWIHDLSNGIMAYQSNVTLSSLVIYSIQPISTYAYVANGSGVYCRGDLGSYILRQTDFGSNAGYSFQNCRWGIYTEYMNVRSSDNNMYNAGTAYRIDRSISRKVNIFNNRVLTLYNGIDLRMNHGAAQLHVYDNHIRHGNIGGVSKGYSAIYSGEVNISNPDTKILRNQIQFLPLSSSRFGININSCDEYLIAENEAYMVNNSFNNYGIGLRGCRLTEVSCNYVLSTDNTFPNPSQAAIRNVMGSDPLFSCNDVDKTANGIIFSQGPAYGTIVRGNKLRYHMWGLHLDPNAIIGQQPPPGQILRSNLWYQAPAPGGYGAWYEDAANAWNFPFLLQSNMDCWR